jgi:hypothetical protein
MMPACSNESDRDQHQSDRHADNAKPFHNFSSGLFLHLYSTLARIPSSMTLVIVAKAK